MTEPPEPGPNREWVLELSPYTDLLTANQRLHFHVKARLVRTLRESGHWLAKCEMIPKLNHAHIVCEIVVPNRRRRDASNWSPTGKAILDGIVDSGVLADDNYEYVTGPDYRLIPPDHPRWRKVKDNRLLFRVRVIETEREGLTTT